MLLVNQKYLKYTVADVLKESRVYEMQEKSVIMSNQNLKIPWVENVLKYQGQQEIPVDVKNTLVKLTDWVAKRE